MASKIPSFSSSLKSVFAGKRKVEISGPLVDKRSQNEENAGQPTLARSKSVSNLANPAPPKPAFTRAPTTLSRTTSQCRPKAGGVMKQQVSGSNLKAESTATAASVLAQRVDKLEQELMKRDGNCDAMNKTTEALIKEKQSTLQVLTEELDSLKLRKRDIEVSAAAKLSQLELKIRDVEFQNGRLERDKSNLDGDMNAVLKENSALKSAIGDLTASGATLLSTLESTQRNLQASKEQAVLHSSAIDKLKQKAEDFESRLRVEETLRTQLENAVQDLQSKAVRKTLVR